MPTAPTAKANYPCTRFDGKGYLTRATSASLQTLGAAGSFLCRVKVGSNKGYIANGILAAGSSPHIRISPDTNKLEVSISGYGFPYSVPNLVLQENVWYDVLVTWQYPGTLTAYICVVGGSDVAGATRDSVSADAWTSTLYVGASVAAAAKLTAGSALRDVMLLPYVVTPEQWAAYKAGVKPTGAVADWPLYPDWNDDSGNANTLTSGGIAPTFNPKAAPTAKAAPTPKAVPA